VLSVASVRSAGGAANYFAKDDYYVGEHASEVSGWGGQGAVELGLFGEVEKQVFEDLLKGKLSDGEQVGDPERRRAGIDLTFSMPKSASVLAYVAGDERLLAAHMQAVRQTMGWVEKAFAEGRTYVDNPKGDPVRTGHLTYALFQHDTSRKLDPQAHIHVVVANLTKVAGNWQALFNDELWKNNSLIGSVYHAALRTLVDDLGYQTRQTGKHGQFEIEGVPKAVLTAFSQRREDVLAKAAEVGITTPQGRDALVIRTRDAKVNLEDRNGLRAEWGSRAEALGFDGKAVVAEAEARAGRGPHEQTAFDAVRQMASVAAQWAEGLREWLKPGDPLVTGGIARLSLSAKEMGAEMAVASAIRILGQREAAFPIHEVSRTALDLGIKGVTIEAVEARMKALADKGQLIFGTSNRPDRNVTHVTTPEHIAEERRLLEGIDAGRGAAGPVLAAGDAATRLQAHSGERPLSGEQLDAGILALSCSDRVVVIQGVAGAGKTTLISAIAETAKSEGRQVLGLAQANTMVEMLKSDAGIEAQTVSSFVNQHLRAALAGQGEAFAASQAALKDTMLVLDEASLVANKPMNDLVTIANRLGLDRLVMIGDRAQLQPIDAGKAFTLIQQHRPAMAKLDVSHRQRTEHMQAVAALTRSGHFRDAFGVLGERVVSSGADFREAAARKWLELSAEDRERTALYASGRETRAYLNAFVQEGLKGRGFARRWSCDLAPGKRQSHPRGIALRQQLPGWPDSGGGRPRSPRWSRSRHL
jgi:conjugative relaxase-like TrwC/TraI family protein